MKLYRVKGWTECYENNRTRTMDEMRWVPIPNKHDGDGYSEMVDGPDGAAILGAWLCIVQVASKCHPRGTLLRDGKIPHTAESISRKCRLPKEAIQKALDKASSPSVGWLDVEDQQDAFMCQSPDINLSPSCQDGADPSIPFHSVPFHSFQGGSKGVFSPPSIEDVLLVASVDFKTTESVARDFFDYYESNGWMVGKSKMKKWKSAFSRWVRNNKSGAYGNQNGNGSHRQPATAKSIVDDRNSRIVGAESTKRAILSECENPGPQPWDNLG